MSLYEHIFRSKVFLEVWCSFLDKKELWLDFLQNGVFIWNDFCSWFLSLTFLETVGAAEAYSDCSFYYFPNKQYN